MKNSGLFKTLGAIACALLATSAFAIDYDAGDLTIVATVPLGEPATLGGGSLTTVDYSNVTSFSGSGFAQGPSALQGANTITRLVADDCTPTGAGAGANVTQFKFSVANFNTVTVSVRPRVRFWNANGAGGAPGTYYSVPAAVGFTFNPIAFPASSVSVVTATVGAGLFTMPGATIWAGVTFDNNSGGTGATAAQLNNFGQGLFNPPTIGSSADQIFETNAAGSFFNVANPAGALLNFGGNPVANLGWEFTTDAPSATESKTWGQVKGLYR